MNSYVQKHKGIHPGRLLSKEIEKRLLTKKSFALSVGEYPQNFNDIIHGRKRIPVALALRIEEMLGFEEGTFVFLQSYYDIAKIRSKSEDVLTT